MKNKIPAMAWLVGALFVSACGGAASNNTATNIEDADGYNELKGIPDPRESIYCAAVEQRVAREDCEDLTTAREQVRRGAAAFNVPNPMQRGQTVPVHLVIDRRAPETIERIESPRHDGLDMGNVSNAIDDGQAVNGTEGNLVEPGNLTTGNTASPVDDPTPTQRVERLPGTPETFLPQVGRFMRAELIGQGFRIVARTPASQEIPAGGQQTWVWDVTALEAGDRSLTLVTVVEGVVNRRHFQLANTPTVKTVTVTVSLTDRIWDALAALPNWIKLVTAVVVALGGLLTAWYGLPWWKRRKLRQSPRPADKTP